MKEKLLKLKACIVFCCFPFPGRQRHTTRTPRQRAGCLGVGSSAVPTPVVTPSLAVEHRRPLAFLQRMTFVLEQRSAVRATLSVGSQLPCRSAEPRAGPCTIHTSIPKRGNNSTVCTTPPPAAWSTPEAWQTACTVHHACETLLQRRQRGIADRWPCLGWIV